MTKNNHGGIKINNLVHASSSLLLLFTLCLGAFFVKPVFAIDEISAKALGGLYPSYPKIDYGKGNEAKLVKRGEYLARIGNCIACHSNPSKKIPAFAGGPPIMTPFGDFYGTNITPDKKTGLGTWNEKDFIRAMQQGVSPDGTNYFPVFPYIHFNRVTKNDLLAIWVYLKKIPPVEYKNKKNTVPFPFNWRFGQYFWKALFFYPSRGEFRYDAEKSPKWNRGAYLVEGLGHCAMCHTPINFLGGQKKEYALTGNFIDGYWAPNITAPALENYTVEEVANTFNEGILTGGAGPVAGPMAEVIHNSLGLLTLDDQLAIATYLKQVQAKQPMGVQDLARMPTLKRGERVYDKACAVCHQHGQASAVRIDDGAYWLKRAKQGRKVLYEHTINGYNNMPTRGGCVNCSNRDVRAAVDYILYKALSRSQLRELDNPQKRRVYTQKDGKRVYDKICSVCHAGGKLGAPKIGDVKVWKPLIRKNMDVLIRNTMLGSYRMPPKGGCAACNTSEVIEAVKYLVQKSRPKGKYDFKLW